MTFQSILYDPILVMLSIGFTGNYKHITYDPSVNFDNRDYSINRESKHDGTLIFTNDLFRKTLFPVINKTTYALKKEPKDFSEVEDIYYTIGILRHTRVIGKVSLPCGNVNGVYERMRLPVIADFKYKQ